MAIREDKRRVVCTLAHVHDLRLRCIDSQSDNRCGFLQSVKQLLCILACVCKERDVVGAIVVVNSVGDVINPKTGEVVAGVRHADGTLADARGLLRSGELLPPPQPGRNTTIAVVRSEEHTSELQSH